MPRQIVMPMHTLPAIIPPLALPLAGIQTMTLILPPKPYRR